MINRHICLALLTGTFCISVGRSSVALRRLQSRETGLECDAEHGLRREGEETEVFHPELFDQKFPPGNLKSPVSNAVLIL